MRKLSSLTDDELKPLVSVLKEYLVDRQQSEGVSRKAVPVNVFFFPDITGVPDVYAPTIVALGEHQDNVVYWQLASPKLVEHIFDEYDVEVPQTVEETVQLYLLIIRALRVSPDVFFGWSFGGVLAFQAGIEALRRFFPHALVVMADAISPDVKNPIFEKEQNWALFEKVWNNFKQSVTEFSNNLPIQTIELTDIVDRDQYSQKETVLEQLEYLCETFRHFLEQKRTDITLRQDTDGSLDFSRQDLINKFNSAIWTTHLVLHNKKAYLAYSPTQALSKVLDHVEKEHGFFFPEESSIISGMTFVYSEAMYEAYMSYTNNQYLGWPIEQTNPGPADLAYSSSSDSEPDDEFLLEEELDELQGSEDGPAPVRVIRNTHHFNMLQSSSQRRLCKLSTVLSDAIDAKASEKAARATYREKQNRETDTFLHSKTAARLVGSPPSSAEGKLPAAPPPNSLKPGALQVKAS